MTNALESLLTHMTSAIKHLNDLKKQAVIDEEAAIKAFQLLMELKELYDQVFK